MYGNVITKFSGMDKINLATGSAHARAPRARVEVHYHFIASAKNIITFFCAFLENHYLGFLGVDFKHPGVAI